MFQLSWEESERSRSQFVTLNEANGKRRVRGQNIKYRPLAFRVVFDAIRELMAPPQPRPKRRIGFVSEGSRPNYQSVAPD
jgi:hypothetical protein